MSDKVLELVARATKARIELQHLSANLALGADADILDATVEALTSQQAEIERLRGVEALADAMKVLLYSDEVFVGTHWDGDFRDPITKSWPALCAHFPNYGADAEEIPEDQYVLLANLIRAHGPDAVSAWVSHQRGLDGPPKGGLSPNGLAALRTLKEKL